MEDVLQDRSRDLDWGSRMGMEEAEDTGCLMEQDAELDSGFCVDVEPESSLAGQLPGGDEHSDPDEPDWFMGGGSDCAAETQEDDLGSVESGETRAESGSEVEQRSEEAELGVCLQPVEESGSHVVISLAEAQSYYSFSRCCRWLCGRCQMLFMCSLNDSPKLFSCASTPVVY